MEALGGKCPYQLLGVDEDASQEQIKKAYRKAALVHHPDRNRDKPDATALFQKLVQAYDMLQDEVAKAAYDKLLKIKKAAKMRDLKLNAEQRKAKHDLEERERAYKRRKKEEDDAARHLDAEIMRLRAQGQRRLEEEQERVRRDLLRGNQQKSGGYKATQRHYNDIDLEKIEAEVLPKMYAAQRRKEVGRVRQL
eukprot:m.94349 g.94349  ORF g.94349 m.94349 type:complete len:194 (-) comp13441_c0_seq2:2173-2754(-)